MSDKTGIQWTDATWPVVTGCTHISDGCDHCYAAQLTGGRLAHLPEYAGLASKGRFNGQVRCLPERLDWPLRWRKPRMIFVANMGDLFHHDVPDEFLERVFDVMERCPQHQFQVLTKRHARMRSFVRARRQRAEDYARAFEENPVPERRTCPAAAWARQRADNPPSNIWLGVSVENQQWADTRIPALLGTPAAIRFVSAEPLLGPVTFRWARWHDWRGAGHLDGIAGLHWLIVGGESGPGARPMEIDWARSLVRECREAGVAPFVKQLGAVRGREMGAGSHGADWDAWPEDLRVREFPAVAEPLAVS